MTTQEKLQRSSDELIKLIEKLTADVPELTEEEIQIGIQKILARCDHKKDQG